MFDNLRLPRFQKILIEILIKLFLKPSQVFFLKIKSGKNPAFSRQRKGGGAVILQDFQISRENKEILNQINTNTY